MAPLSVQIQEDLAETKINLIQSCISKNTIIRLENTIIALCSTLVISYVVSYVQFGVPW